MGGVFFCLYGTKSLPAIFWFNSRFLCCREIFHPCEFICHRAKVTGIFSNIHANGSHILAAHAVAIPSRKCFYSAGISCGHICLYRILGVGLIKKAKNYWEYCHGRKKIQQGGYRNENHGVCDGWLWRGTGLAHWLPERHAGLGRGLAMTRPTSPGPGQCRCGARDGRTINAFS